VGWAAKLLVMAGSLALLFVAAEAVSALFLPAPVVWRYPQEAYLYDPGLLHRLEPNQRAFTHAHPVVTNSYGLRDDEFPLRPAPGRVRVLCLGDSLTFGKGVALPDTYPKQLETLLNGSGERRYEVINAGVSAYDTWQEVKYLGEQGWTFEPDLVIVGFYANDIVPRPRSSVAGADPGDGPHAVMRSRADRAIYWLKGSRILLLLRERAGQLWNRIRPSAEMRHKTSLLHGTPDPLVEAGWREVESSLAELAALAARHRFDVLVVFFPMADQLLADYPNASYPARAQAIAARHGLPAIDLRPAFAREFSGFGSLFIQWDGHPNPRAFAIAAREIRNHVVSAQAKHAVR
jgi:lysophospholipase L1-like esterase